MLPAPASKAFMCLLEVIPFSQLLVKNNSSNPQSFSNHDFPLYFGHHSPIFQWPVDSLLPTPLGGTNEDTPPRLAPVTQELRGGAGSLLETKTTPETKPTLPRMEYLFRCLRIHVCHNRIIRIKGRNLIVFLVPALLPRFQTLHHYYCHSAKQRPLGTNHTGNCMCHKTAQLSH